MKSRPLKVKRVTPVFLTPDEAKRQQAKQIAIDVQPQKFMTHMIPGAQRLNIDVSLRDIPKSQPILMTCLTGQRSLSAAQQLINRGYRQVYVLKGGLVAWQRAGYTVSRAKFPV